MRAGRRTILVRRRAHHGPDAPANPGAPYPRPKGGHEVVIERDVMVPMRDGVRLATDIYRPSDVSGPLPTILIRTPYNKSAYRAATVRPISSPRTATRSSCRTCAASSHRKVSFRVYEGDMTDWSDMFDWIGKQSWSTGKVGTYGCSYLGEGQIVAAQTRHPRHVAAIAQAAGGNLGRVGRRRQFWGSVEGGAFSISINFGWMPMYASIDKGMQPMPKSTSRRSSARSRSST